MIKACTLTTMLAISGALAAPASQPAGDPGAVAAVPSAGEVIRLVFSVDQGFGNGVVVNHDLAAVGRICDAVKTFTPPFQGILLFNPQVADRDALHAALDVVVARDVCFMLEVYTSDCQTLGTTTVQNAPADGPHGICLTMDRLAAFKRKYGRHLVGLRMTEVFSQDFTNRAVRTTNPEWNSSGWKASDDAFFQADLARPFLRFARDAGMFVQFSDWHWFRFADWDEPLKAQEEALRGLLAEFPGVVIVTYANNEPQDKSVPRLSHWHEAVEPFLAAGAAGIGLSDQAWLREPEMSCPVEEVIAWALQTLRINSRYLQFEPAWYFFKLPRGTFHLGDYRNDPRYADSGTPLPNFAKLKAALEKGH